MFVFINVLYSLHQNPSIMKTKREIFIADGRFFSTYEEVENYARENGYRITNTSAIKTPKGIRHLIDLNK